MSDALGEIVASVGGDRERSTVVEGFAHAVLRRAGSAPLEDADPAAVAAALADAFDFVDRRPAGQIWVRLVDRDVALDGGRPVGTLLEIACDDRQFIVTTVKEELHRLGQRVVRILHPVYGSERGPDGRLTAVLPARPAQQRESFLQVELATRVPPEMRPSVVEAIRRVLVDVFAATDDHLAMRAALAQVVAGMQAYAGLRYDEEEVAEAGALLKWLLDDNFVLLGTCRIRPSGEAVDSLGTLADPQASLRRAPSDLDAAQLLRIAPTAEISTVHRQVPLQRIDVAEVDTYGSPSAVFRLVGVFSHKSNAEPAPVTPVLRTKLRRILELEDVVEGSQDEASLVSLFQVLPKEELFQTDVQTLRQVMVGLLAAEEQHDVRVRLRVEPATHTVSALLSLPQDMYNPALRQRLERFLVAQLDGSRVDTQVSLGDRADAILRLVVQVEGPLPEERLDAVEREIRLLCRTWEQEMAATLAVQVGEGRANHLVQTWASWFPAAYRDTVRAGQAVEDLLQLAAVVERGGDVVNVQFTTDPTRTAQVRLKVFSVGTAVELSRFLPIVESLGLWAVEELSYPLGPPERRVHLHDFGVNNGGGGPLDVAVDGPRLADAALALWHGWAEVDSLNRLVLRAGLTWDDVALLRAYHRYRNQLGAGFTTAYVAEVLVENPDVARAVVDLFRVRFDPERTLDPVVEAALRERGLRGCDAVARLDHDRILRGFFALVDATLRTNRYLRPGGTHVALKFDSARLPGVRHPVPYREIFVYGPSTEGVHLRWGPIARGGIRWSERTDDYRTEMLGLMRTQVMKNALIVPTGAKGGFVVKRQRYGDGADVTTAQAYEIFISSLLDVTDNVVGGEVVPVARRRDGDDPYLVVAADRGTARFSDLANQLSEQRRFWLGDAFASGGSRGYDHKRLGITARGAWVAIGHHFTELGVDLDSDPGTTVVGIGDMSGDVFGNGLLQSDRIRLVAAFDHRDVFLDPTPDPAVSYRERARLFALPSSSWQDYDRTLISPGGGVWSRLDKRIDLSPEARAVLGVEVDHLTPSELIRAILQAPVGLLFAGGIGTFVRASTEEDERVDDRVNTDVRVEASSVRARVVGEGANLAFTQRARIEYAWRGGRINTDAIDNSGGVDISDREVNLKILLGPAVEASRLTMAERDTFLAEVCDDVVAAVLDDSLQQSLALSRSHFAGADVADAFEELIADLETNRVLERDIEALPAAEEIRSPGRRPVMTRPELAVLLAGAKRRLTAQLVESTLPDQPALREVLVAYFPPAVGERFGDLLDRHRLRRELVASEVANEVVNRMGPTFVNRLATESGVGGAAVAAAYWVARGVSGASSLWHALDRETEEGRVAPAAAGTLMGLLEALTRAYLRSGGGEDIAAAIARDGPVFDALRLDRPLDELQMVPDIAELTRRTGRAVVPVAAAFLQIGQALGIEALLDGLRTAPVVDRWSRAAWQGLVDDLHDVRRAAARRALEDHPDGGETEAVAAFLAARSRLVAEALDLVTEMQGQAQPRLDALAVATRAVRRAVE